MFVWFLCWICTSFICSSCRTAAWILLALRMISHCLSSSMPTVYGIYLEPVHGQNVGPTLAISLCLASVTSKHSAVGELHMKVTYLFHYQPGNVEFREGQGMLEGFNLHWERLWINLVIPKLLVTHHWIFNEKRGLPHTKCETRAKFWSVVNLVLTPSLWLHLTIIQLNYTAVQKIFYFCRRQNLLRCG